MKGQTAMQRAIYVLGSQTRLGREIGCSQTFIHRMVNGTRSVSLEVALRIEQATRGLVLAEELRPDLASLIRQWRTGYISKEVQDG